MRAYNERAAAMQKVVIAAANIPNICVCVGELLSVSMEKNELELASFHSNVTMGRQRLRAFDSSAVCERRTQEFCM